MSKAKKSLEGQKYGRSDLDRIGLFSEAGYISTGEAYNKINDLFLGYRCKGKQFQIETPKVGREPREPYNRIFENEPYTDLVVLRRRNRLQEKTKNISSTPFRPSSIPPKPSGKGSHWGTIEQQWPLLKKDAEPLLPPKEVPGEHEVHHELKNIVTRPPKKGSGYGFPDVTIGKQYEYISDPYDRAESILRKERTENHKRNIATRAFVSASAKLDFFNQFICLDADQTKKSSSKPSSSKSSLPPIVPFKPTSSFGYTINPYPSYEPPRFVPKEEPKKTIPKIDVIFKPSGMTGSYPIRSMVEVNTPLAPPKWLQMQLKKAILESNF